MLALSSSQPPHIRDDSSGPELSAQERPCVLLVEDHEDTRFMLRTMLEKRGINVLEAADGEEGVRLALKLRPRLILMDAGLPRLDGLAATRRIRDADGDGSLPIVFLSGHAELVTQDAARAAGADDFLVKPFDFEQLAEVLERHLGNSSTETEK